MPINGEHYVGVRFDAVDETIDRIAADPGWLERVGAQPGAQWALDHYSPRALARRAFSSGLVRARLERKVAEIQRWIGSVAGAADWPAAGALAMFRTRPAAGEGILARWSRRLMPHIWVRPARLNGLAVRISPAEVSQFVIYEEVFIDGVYDLDQVAFAPDAIIDCGAFEGYFSLLAATRFPGVPIVAFEPNERNLDGLRANVSRNRRRGRDSRRGRLDH